MVIPFIHSHPRKEPPGYRVKHLSQNNYGQFFDLKISKTKKRIRRKKCRLSEEAIKFFKQHQEKVKKNEKIS